MSLPRPLLYLFFGLAIFLVYAGCINGQPIWDDNAFIFWRFSDHHTPDHWRYWRYHIWPLFDSFAALFYGIFEQRVEAWHLLSLLLHILNGILLKTWMDHFKKSWAIPMMLLYLVHPLNVLSVAWMIQIKTVMCGTFILLACHTGWAWWRQNTKKTYFLTLLFFAAATFAKSAALPFPWIALGWILVRKKFHTKLFYALLPFMLLTLWSTWRIAGNSMVQTNVGVAEKVVQQQATTPTAAVVSLESNGDTAPVEAPTPEPTQPVEEDPDVAAALAVATAPVIEAPKPVEQLPPIVQPSKLKLIAHTLGQYLFFPWLPWPVSPVHGAYQGGIKWQSIAGYAIAILMLIAGFIKKTKLPMGFILSQIGTLVPFVGLIVAPYMTYTSVSEQHFYLILPFALAGQLWLFDQFKDTIRNILLIVIGISFAIISADYVRDFRDERVFYARILDYRPEDRLAAVNLAAHYAHNGQPKVALRIVEKALKQAEENPALKQEALHRVLIHARDLYQIDALKSQ